MILMENYYINYIDKGKGFVKDYEFSNTIIIFSVENLSKQKLEGNVKGKEYDYNG